MQAGSKNAGFPIDTHYWSDFSLILRAGLNCNNSSLISLSSVKRESSHTLWSLVVRWTQDSHHWLLQCPTLSSLTSLCSAYDLKNCWFVTFCHCSQLSEDSSSSVAEREAALITVRLPCCCLYWPGHSVVTRDPGTTLAPPGLYTGAQLWGSRWCSSLDIIKRSEGETLHCL